MKANGFKSFLWQALVVCTGVCWLVSSSPAAADLVLNGIASEQELNTEYFLAALYLSTASNDASEALAMKGPKRMEMRVTSDNFTPRKFSGLWRDSLVINNSPADVDKFGQDMLKFSSLMKGKLVTGDQVIIDQSASATVVSVNGIELARFSPEFFPILLRTWIGPRPESSDFKKDLLSKGSIKDEFRTRYNNVVPLDGRKQLATLWSTDDGAAAAKAAEEAAKAQAEADANARAEAEARAQVEAKAKAEAQARAEAEAKAKAEAQARAEAEAKAKAEAQARAEAEAKAKAEAKARQEEQARLKAEADARAVAETKAKAEAAKAAEDARQAALKAASDAQAKADAEAKAKAAEEARLRAEQEAKARAAAEAQAKLEEEARQKAEAEAQAEAQARAAAEAKAKAEAEARAQAAAKAEEEAKKRAEAEAQAAKAEAEAKKQAEADALAEKQRQEAAAKAPASVPTVAKPSADDENAAVEFDAAQAKRELYKSKLVAWVYKELEYPEKEKHLHREGNIQLKVTITRDGKLVDVTLLQETKYPNLNVAAKNAARLAQPYPAMPKEIEGDTFEFVVPVLFRSE